ncbi:MAG: hypothetical protein IK085_02455, partial [Clostridia bacterium]|nr:hypothetical protein [Clostridia bacterium]
IFNTCAPGGCFSSNAVRDEHSSPVYRDGSTVICPLGESLTSTGVLCVQVAAYKTSGTACSAVRKSDILTLTFMPSVMGADGFLTDSAGFENEVRSAIEEFRTYSESFDEIHSHANIAVLEGLSEENGRLCFNGETVCEEYTLPTASLLSKGGVKPGFGLEMTGEYLGVSDEFIKICTAVTACRTSSDESILHVISGTPAEYDYIDGDNPGLTEYIYELDIGRTKLYYIPTQSGIIEWLDFSDTVHTLSLEAGVIYLFELDPDTGTFSVRCKEPNEV